MNSQSRQNFSSCLVWARDFGFCLPCRLVAPQFERRRKRLREQPSPFRKEDLGRWDR